MRPAILDPTAGERARQIRAHPGAPHRIVDPTDPRHGKPLDAGRSSGEARRIVDPTDPQCGNPAA